MKAILAASCLAWVTACASPDPVHGSGRSLVLERPLTIPADAATVRLQYGRVVPRNGVQDQDPFCVVELNTVRDTPQTLAPGRFEIMRVTRTVSQIAAAPSPFRQVGFGHDDEPSFLYFITEFRLRDPAQPDLRSMHCAWNQMAPGNRGLMRHLTLFDIQGALGNWITFEPLQSLP